MRHCYRWEGRVHEDAEHQLMIKTTRGRVGSLQHRVAALHPYDVPEFLVVPVAEQARPTRAWLRQSVDSS